jgi:hypothetical protein
VLDLCLRQHSYNYPGYYLRHYNYQLRVDLEDGTDLFRSDSSFLPVTAWALPPRWCRPAPAGGTTGRRKDPAAGVLAAPTRS